MKDDENKDEKSFLTLRNARDLVILCLILIATWKLLNSDISISIEKFAFTDILSLLVSFFAIGLSVAFYFKATETSNRFYDNSYKFTKEISEILGRIEAGFGEKLKHIDEGYAGIRDRFDQLPFDANKAKEEIEEEKAEIEKKKKEQTELLESLASRAKLAETEKNELFQQMERTSNELESAKSDLKRMERNVRAHEASMIDPELRKRVTEYLADKIYQEAPPGIEKNPTTRMIKHVFNGIRDDLHRDAIEDLLNTGLMDEDGELSMKAVDLIRFKLRKR